MSAPKSVLNQLQAIINYLETQYMGQVPPSILKDLDKLKSYLKTFKL